LICWNKHIFKQSEIWEEGAQPGVGDRTVGDRLVGGREGDIVGDRTVGDRLVGGREGDIVGDRTVGDRMAGLCVEAQVRAIIKKRNLIYIR
jgi:hypothetical protein